MRRRRSRHQSWCFAAAQQREPCQSRYPYCSPHWSCSWWRTHTRASLSWRTIAHEEDPCWSRGKVQGGRRSREKPLISWPQLPFPLALAGVRKRANRVKVPLAKKEESVVLMVFNPYFLKLIWPYFNWQYIKLTFPKLNPLSVLILTHETFHRIFFLSGWKGKVSEQLGELWMLTKDNSPHWENNGFQTH